MVIVQRLKDTFLMVSIHVCSFTSTRLSFYPLQIWRDEVMTWNPRDFGNITRVFMDSKYIWTPDIRMYNL